MLKFVDYIISNEKLWDYLAQKNYQNHGEQHVFFKNLFDFKITVGNFTFSGDYLSKIVIIYTDFKSFLILDFILILETVSFHLKIILKCTLNGIKMFY